jgi:hypothetical protein
MFRTFTKGLFGVFAIFVGLFVVVAGAAYNPLVSVLGFGLIVWGAYLWYVSSQTVRITDK